MPNKLKNIVKLTINEIGNRRSQFYNRVREILIDSGISSIKNILVPPEGTIFQHWVHSPGIFFFKIK